MLKSNRQDTLEKFPNPVLSTTAPCTLNHGVHQSYAKFYYYDLTSPRLLNEVLFLILSFMIVIALADLVEKYHNTLQASCLNCYIMLNRNLLLHLYMDIEFY